MSDIQKAVDMLARAKERANRPYDPRENYEWRQREILGFQLEAATYAIAAFLTDQQQPWWKKVLRALHH